MASSDESPALTLPPGETVGSDGTIAVAGASYTDSFVQSNPGSMYVGISDGSGGLYGCYPGIGGDVAAAGSGGNTITFSGSYADVQDIINSLTYVATVGGGSDDIHYDVWNQAGVETTGDVPVTIRPAADTDTWTGSVSRDWNTGANWSAGMPPATSDTVAIPGAAPFDATLTDATLTGETITLGGGASQAASVNFTNVTLDSVLGGNGTVVAGGTLTIGAGGTLALQNFSTVESAAPAAVVNDGTIVSTAGAHLYIENGGTAGGGNPTLVNNGIIEADGGAISIQLNASGAQPETLQNSGTVAISGDGSVWLNGTFAGGAIAFNGSGELTLQQGMAFAGGATVTGFGPGDQIDLFGSSAGKDGALSIADGTLDVSAGGTIMQAIPLAGSYTLGNFELETVAAGNNSSVIAYAPGDGRSGIVSPDVVAPSSDTVTQGGTLLLNDVTIDASGTTQAGITIVAQSGALFMNGASGSGTSRITVGLTPVSQINSDLASLTYVPAAGASNDVVSITALPPAPVKTTRLIPIGINSGSTPPGLHEPASESVAAGGAVAVGGRYVDSFAQGNPGDLYLGISDSSGTLYATDASGSPLAGSGTNSISLGTDFRDLNAALASLRYLAGGSAGSDRIYFDIWNQAGIRTTDTVPVAVTAGGSTTETWTGAVSSDWNMAGDWSGGVVPASGDAVMISQNTTNTASLSNATLTGETITLGGLTAGVNFTDVTLGSGTVLDGAGTLNIGDTLTVGPGATLALSGSVPVVGIGGTTTTIVNDGTIQSRTIPVSVGAAISGPDLSEPSGETVAPGGTVAVGGSYSDSFAQHNPGQLYVGVSDNLGTLSATDAAGHAVAGSGTNNIGVGTDYVDVNAILASLRYTAGSGAGSDTIQFQVWNQAGVDTTTATSIAIDPQEFTASANQVSTTAGSEFVGPGVMSPDVTASSTDSSWGAMMPIDTTRPPIGVPLALHS